MCLQELDLSSNNLTGSVKIQEFSELQNLSTVLSSNNLTLSFNNSMDLALPKLSHLGLASCNIFEFPSFLKSSTALKYLDLSKNQINGSVPTWLWEVSKDSIYYLDLSHNSFTYIRPLPWLNLEYLDLHDNSFSGPLPITSSPYLYAFLASKKRFSGEIPTSNYILKFPRVLDLSFNSLIGKIPKCLGRLRNLSVLDLRRNKLRGNISTIIVQGSNLRTINLNGNQLEGMIPRSLVNCRNHLEVLDLGNNMLSDTFPDWLEPFPKLQVLVLRGNKFHGSIRNPETRLSFPRLRIMDLSHNEFAGALPNKYFENFKAMQTGTAHTVMSNMGEYYYEDSVTVTMKGFEFELVRIQTIFTTIDFSSNNFSGEIPEVLGELVSLKGLNLSHNTRVGIVPPSLGHLSNLEWLDLSSNELVGKIPIKLASIPWLAILNLSHNHLEGPIPHGPQFNTFGNDSFEGNLNLCGFPLSKRCDKQHTAALSLSDLEQEGQSNIFSWKIMMMGYASCDRNLHRIHAVVRKWETLLDSGENHGRCSIHE